LLRPDPSLVQVSAIVTGKAASSPSIYKTAISEGVSQGEAEKARQDMARKDWQLLRRLNEGNSHINIKEGAQFTATEVLFNSRVMGRLLDILVADSLPHEDEWSYARQPLVRAQLRSIFPR
jgi:hypothetical protein